LTVAARYLRVGLVLVTTSVVVGVLQEVGDWTSGLVAAATVLVILLTMAVAARLGLLDAPPERRRR
jgi:hypothetical protein